MLLIILLLRLYNSIFKATREVKWKWKLIINEDAGMMAYSSLYTLLQKIFTYSYFNNRTEIREQKKRKKRKKYIKKEKKEKKIRE